MLIILSIIAIAESCSATNNSVLLDMLKNGDYSYINWILIVFFTIFTACAIRLYLLIRELVRLVRGKFNLPSLLNEILPEMAWFVFVSGMAIYYVGYAYAGTADNVATLTVRSALSAFEMFLSKSNLIGIAENCKADSYYMFSFALFHALAVMISMIFAIACFGKRLKDYVRGFIWKYTSQKYGLNVFWGFNEKNILLAKNIYEKAGGKERIVFIDWPQAQEENRTGQSFSGIMGLLSYQTNAAKLLSDIKYILLRSSTSPDTIATTHPEILREINLGKLAKFMSISERTNFFILSNNK